jgi:hypothetical protein
MVNLISISLKKFLEKCTKITIATNSAKLGNLAALKADANYAT